METTQCPIVEHLDRIGNMVENHQTIIVVAPTGAGKSTELPLHLFYTRHMIPGRIGVTQPRRVAAQMLARYVAGQSDTELGDEIGYQVKDDVMCHRDSKLVYMTSGVLLGQLHSDPLLRVYDVVILDEVHERETNVDLLLALLKQTLRQRPTLRLIIMSATVDAARMATLFDNAPVVTVEGRMYPVERCYAPYTPRGLRELVKMITMYVVQYVNEHSDGDILIFLPDEFHISAVATAVLESGIDAAVHQLYGHQTREKQELALRPSARRRVICATNIAETSLTIDGVVYVLDSGLIKQTYYIDEYSSALTVTNHSKAGCKQREGRAGRTRPGIYQALYSEYDQYSFPDYTPPEIKRTALGIVLLDLFARGMTMDAILRLEFLDPPTSVAWANARAILHTFGFIDDTNHLTETGVLVHKLRLAPLYGKMIVEGIRADCLEQMCAIAVLLTLPQGILYNVHKWDNASEIEKARKNSGIIDPQSDMITTLNAFEYLHESHSPGSDAKALGLNYYAYQGAQREITSMLETLERLDIPLTHIASDEDREPLYDALYYSFEHHLVDKLFGDQYRGNALIHPSSVTVSEDHQLLVYAHYKIDPRKKWLWCCHSVNPLRVIERVGGVQACRLEVSATDDSVTMKLFHGEMLLLLQKPDYIPDHPDVRLAIARHLLSWSSYLSIGSELRARMNEAYLYRYTGAEELFTAEIARRLVVGGTMTDLIAQTDFVINAMNFVPADIQSARDAEVQREHERVQAYQYAQHEAQRILEKDRQRSRGRIWNMPQQIFEGFCLSCDQMIIVDSHCAHAHMTESDWKTMRSDIAAYYDLVRAETECMQAQHRGALILKFTCDATGKAVAVHNGIEYHAVMESIDYPSHGETWLCDSIADKRSLGNVYKQVRSRVKVIDYRSEIGAMHELLLEMYPGVFEYIVK